MSAWLGLLLMGLLFIALLSVFFARAFFLNSIRKWLDRSSALASGKKCICGYSLEELDQARCPECGRVIHFDATPEELGLTTAELERAQTKRKERGRGAEK